MNLFINATIRIRQFFCRHDFEVMKKKTLFCNLNGTQLYKRCKRCGKVIPYRFISNEEEALLYHAKGETNG